MIKPSGYALVFIIYHIKHERVYVSYILYNYKLVVEYPSYGLSLKYFNSIVDNSSTAFCYFRNAELTNVACKFPSPSPILKLVFQSRSTLKSTLLYRILVPRWNDTTNKCHCPSSWYEYIGYISFLEGIKYKDTDRVNIPW